MIRRLWVAAAVLVPLLVTAVPAAFLAAIWAGSGRLFWTGVVLIFVAAPSGLAFGFWTNEAKPKPNLPRADRKRLRDEARRIRLDAEVARLEREAGIR